MRNLVVILAALWCTTSVAASDAVAIKAAVDKALKRIAAGAGN